MSRLSLISFIVPHNENRFKQVVDCEVQFKVCRISYEDLEKIQKLRNFPSLFDSKKSNCQTLVLLFKNRYFVQFLACR